MEAASPPGAASENSSNDVEEVKGGGWGCGCGGRPNPKLEGSVTKMIARSRPLIFLPFQPGFPACGGQLRQQGPEQGDPRHAHPGHSHTRETLGALDRFPLEKLLGMFPGGPWVCWSPWQPGSPVEQQPPGAPGTS